MEIFVKAVQSIPTRQMRLMYPRPPRSRMLSTLWQRPENTPGRSQKQRVGYHAYTMTVIIIRENIPAAGCDPKHACVTRSEICAQLIGLLRLTVELPARSRALGRSPPSATVTGLFTKRRRLRLRLRCHRRRTNPRTSLPLRQRYTGHHRGQPWGRRC